MSDGPQPAAARPWVVAKSAWRRWQGEGGTGGAEPDARIGIASSFTDNTIVPFLGAHLLQEGLKPEIILAPYNQLFQACIDPRKHFGDECGIIVLLWRLEDLMADEIAAFLGDENGSVARAKDKIAAFVAAIAKLRANHPGMIIVGTPPFPTGQAVGALALDNAKGLGCLHRSLSDHFLEAIGRVEAIRLCDLDAVQRVVGLESSFDPCLWYLYRQPFSDRFLHQAGTLLGRIVVASRRSAKKCVVLDCDNTLWGGIVGEDGLDGIQLGDEFPGVAYRDFQKLLLYWRQQGVLLALASKNNEADVWEVFDQHGGMILDRAHISAWQIHWGPKAQSIPLIAQALNIGVDSLVFIDDSAMEVEYMRQAQPDVVSLLLPEDPAEIVSTLQCLTFFDRLDVSREDRMRADAMRAELDRDALSAKMSKEEFLKALELRMELYRPGPEDLGRVAQLINKTNQFNLTTVRRTLEEVRGLASSPDHRLYALRVADKFGDYGLTGVAILRVGSGGWTWYFDTLLLSCRVLGRGVETALMTALADDARREGALEFTACFIPTRKNALASTYLPDHGFKVQSDGTWRLALAEAPPFPDFVTLVRSSSDVTQAA